MLLQSGFVMPAFAEDMPFSYNFIYGESDIISYVKGAQRSDFPDPDSIENLDEKLNNHAVIIPDSAASKDPQVQHAGTAERTTPTTLGDDWPEEPYRVIGYTFDGWYTTGLLNTSTWTIPDSIELRGDTVIDDDFLYDYSDDYEYHSITLQGKWTKYASPYLNSGSVSFKNKNSNGEFLSDDIKLFSADDFNTEVEFDKDTEEYWAYVYGDTSAMNITFDQYEPDAESVVTANGTEVELATDDSNPIELTGVEDAAAYSWRVDGEALVEDPEVVTGKRYITEYFDLGDKGAVTDVTVTVTLPDTGENTGRNEKTYTFHIMRYARELKLGYGNTPYGRMSTLNSSNPTALASDKANFNSNYRYSNIYYSPNAWNYKGGNEVIKGSELTGNDYYNYDKDDTAIVVYSGLKFTDPGVTLYDDSGSIVDLNSADVTRRLIYKTVPSLKYSDWTNEIDRQSTEEQLTGADGENIIDILEHNGTLENAGQYIKPGIYTIEYTFTPSDGKRAQTLQRSMIVLPQNGDINMDTYLSALDSYAYDMNIPDGTASNNLYKYRAMDRNRDGVVDETDKNEILNRNSRSEIYSSISIAAAAAANPTDYTPPAAHDGKAVLNMQYINNQSNPGSSLEQGNVFYVGYSFADLANASALTSGKVKSITLSFDYDQRYIRPFVSNTSALVARILADNANLAAVSVSIKGQTSLSTDYTFDMTTASIYKWKSTPDVKTLAVEMFPEGDMTLADGDFLKIPFVVSNVPDSGVKVLSARLDAKGFNMNIGGSYYMWDTSDSANSVTTNLLTLMEYGGDCELPFGDEPEPEDLDVLYPDVEYGTSYSMGGFEINSTAEGIEELGFEYSDMGSITGTPKVTGVHTFRVGGKKYKLTIHKAEMRVVADDNQSKVYGEDNPALTFHLDSDCYKNNDSTKADELKAAVEGVTEIKTTAEKRSGVGGYRIYFDYTQTKPDATTTYYEVEGDSIQEIENYYLTLVENELTINPREIKITGVSDIPKCSLSAYPGPVSVQADNTGFTAIGVGSNQTNNETGILTGDSVSVSYRVYYTGGESGKSVGTGKPVRILGNEGISNTDDYNLKILDTGDGNNYILMTDHPYIDYATGGEVIEATMTGFTVTKWCDLTYTYGTPLNLDSGNIRITYEETDPADLTFEAAKSAGLRIRFFDGAEAFSEVINNGRPLFVSDTGRLIHVDFPEKENDPKFFKTSLPITVNPMPITLVPDNKTRYYGFDTDNDHVFVDGDTTQKGFTYTIKEGRIVTETGYGDTEAGIITSVQYTCDAPAEEEIGTEPITMTATEGSDNYKFSFEPGTLTIAPRPIKVTGITNVPRLTSDYYLDSSGNAKAIEKVPNTASAGGTEAATMTVDSVSSFAGGLFTKDGVADKIRIKYNAVYPSTTPNNYADTSPLNTMSVGISDIELDGDYEKNKNYTIDTSNSTKNASGGVVYARQIKEVTFSSDSPLKTEYTYGETLDLSKTDGDGDKNIIHVVYDNGYEEDITVKEAIENHSADWTLTYTKPDENGVQQPYTTGVSGHTDRLQVADTGTVITLKAKTIYSNFENEDDFTYSDTLTVNRAVLTVNAKTLYATYGEEIPELAGSGAIDISGFKYEDTRADITEPSIVCYGDDGKTEIHAGASVGTPAGDYMLRLVGGGSANYEFAPSAGSLIISPRPLIITNIDIDDLTSAQAYAAATDSESYPDGKYTEVVTVHTAEEPDRLTFDSTYGLLSWGGVKDALEITYRVTFREAPFEGKTHVAVDITEENSNVKYGSGRNYYIQRVTTPQYGDVTKALISKITVTDDPSMTTDGEGNEVQKEYSYGDYLDIGKCTIEYDSGRVLTNIPFDKLSDYGITVKHPYEDRNIADDEWEKIFLKVGNDKSLTLVPEDAEKSPSYNGDDAATGNIKVVKRKVNIYVNDAEYIYGDNPVNGTERSDSLVAGKYSYRFEDDEFAVGEKSFALALGSDAHYTAPVLSCTDTNSSSGSPDSKSAAGTYDIIVEEENLGSSTNYEFVFDEANKGTLTVKKRPIVITSIDEGAVGMLTAQYIRQNNFTVPSSAHYTSSSLHTMSVKTNRNGGDITTTVNNDAIGITFNAIYDSSKTNPTEKIKVDIDTDSIALSTDTEKYPNIGNYELAAPLPSTSDWGSVEKPEIRRIYVENEPDNYPKLEYNYGDVFELSGGRVTVEYNSEVSQGVYYKEYPAFDELDDYDITLTYESTGEEVKDRGRISVIEHDGSALVLTLDTDPTKTFTTDRTVTVHPQQLPVIIDPHSFTYGDEPPALNTGSAVPAADGTTDAGYHYATGYLVNGDSFTSDNFVKGLEAVIPQLSCDADENSEVGEYDITASAKVVDANKKSNYLLTYDDTGVMTVERREITVTSIDSGIPVLTSQIIREDKRASHSLSGYAATDDEEIKMTASNLVHGDDIKISYDAVYDSADETDSADIKVTHMRVLDDYGKGKNYKVDYTAELDEKGVIKNREISALTIEQQPDLEYTYGDTLNLNSGRIKITYDDGSVEEVRFNNLPDGKAVLTYKDGSEAKDNDVLYVNYHNRNTLTVKVTSPHTVPDQETEQMTVYKRKLRVKANPVTSTYGDDITFTWDYVDEDADFVNGDTKTKSNYTRGLTLPIITCRDNDNVQAGKTTAVGTYPIIISGASASNYEFVYTNSSLTINKRPIDINSIDSGVPMLTAKFLHENSGPNYKLNGTAVNTEGQMTVTNIANRDSVKITYTAVYNYGAPSNKVRVNLENISLDDSYGKSSNYRLAYTVTSSSNGSINDRNIEKMYVKVLPQLDYSYGSALNLKDGILHIIYDDESYEDIPFNDIAAEGNKYDITLKYSGMDKKAVSGDILDIDEYNGRPLEIIVNKSIYNVSKITTEPLLVTQRTLFYGACDVDTIVYNGQENRTTTGTIKFSNAANDEVPTARGTFTFTDHNAGVNIPVEITGITLDGQWTHNYVLATDNTTAYGNILKDDTPIPTETVEYVFSEDTNTLTITPFEMDEYHTDGGAKYEYSIDGINWQESNVFEDIDIGQVCSISVRYADTDNFNASQSTTPVNAQSHTAKLTLISRDKPEEGEDYEVLASFYTYVTEIAKENDLKELIGDIEKEEKKINYYSLTEDLEGKTSLKYPLELLGDVKIYTTLRAPSSGGGLGGGGAAIPKATATPEPTESPTPSGAPEPTATPVPGTDSKKNIPYMSGFENMIKPDDYMTRAEAATIMVILSGDTGEEYENVFPDVREDTWYIRYIAEANARGLISGFDDGNFYPEQTVTREQFAAMVVRMAGIDPIEGQSFSDVEEWRWSAGSINAAVKAGIVSGYDDGTFLPENPTRRSEAVRMINTATGRIPDKELIDTLTCPYTDLPKDHWAYYEFMIAATEFDIPE